MFVCVRACVRARAYARPLAACRRRPSAASLPSFPLLWARSAFRGQSTSAMNAQKKRVHMLVCVVPPVNGRRGTSTTSSASDCSAGIDVNLRERLLRGHCKGTDIERARTICEPKLRRTTRADYFDDDDDDDDNDYEYD